MRPPKDGRFRRAIGEARRRRVWLRVRTRRAIDGAKAWVEANGLPPSRASAPSDVRVSTSTASPDGKTPTVPGYVPSRSPRAGPGCTRSFVRSPSPKTEEGPPSAARPRNPIFRDRGAGMRARSPSATSFAIFRVGARGTGSRVCPRPLAPPRLATNDRWRWTLDFTRKVTTRRQRTSSSDRRARWTSLTSPCLASPRISAPHSPERGRGGRRRRRAREHLQPVEALGGMALLERRAGASISPIRRLELEIAIGLVDHPLGRRLQGEAAAGPCAAPGNGGAQAGTNRGGGEGRGGDAMGSWPMRLGYRPPGHANPARPGALTAAAIVRGGGVRRPPCPPASGFPPVPSRARRIEDLCVVPGGGTFALVADAALGEVDLVEPVVGLYLGDREPRPASSRVGDLDDRIKPFRQWGPARRGGHSSRSEEASVGPAAIASARVRGGEGGGGAQSPHEWCPFRGPRRGPCPASTRRRWPMGADGLPDARRQRFVRRDRAGSAHGCPSPPPAARSAPSRRILLAAGPSRSASPPASADDHRYEDDDDHEPRPRRAAGGGGASSRGTSSRGSQAGRRRVVIAIEIERDDGRWVYEITAGDAVPAGCASSRWTPRPPRVLELEEGRR